MSESRQKIDEQAAEWMLCLSEADVSDARRRAFEAWKQQSPEHAAAAARMHEVVERMQSLRPQRAPAQAALNAAVNGSQQARQRRRALRALLLIGCLALPATLLVNSRQGERWLADISTAPRDWKTIELADHSTLTLNGSSAVDVHFDAGQRRIELLQGEILVQVAHDPQRPFVVATEQGTLRALGTRFVVKRDRDATILTLLQSRVAAHSTGTGQTLEVAAGSQARVSVDGVRVLGTVDIQGIDQAWQRHQLVVDNQPLPQVLDELARHHRGHLQFDRRALAHLRVSAVLPLDDPERALQLVAESLPVQVQQYTPWWVVVSALKAAEK
ncbi:FecR family protein [Pseudomonas sp. 3A(2025)]